MTKKCKNCKEPIVNPYTTIQTWCSSTCAIALARKKQAKDNNVKAKLERKAHRAAKERLKTKGDWLREAQTEFNKFIRLRDKSEPCICCGCVTNDDNLLTGSRWDAGHYLSVGARPNLRFNEDNCHKQSVKCNRHLSGNAAAYRIGLVKKIGLERVELLEFDHKPKRYTIDDLKEIKKTYKQKTKELSNNLGIV